MKNPAPMYKSLDERTLLEALQLCLSGEGLNSYLWQDYQESFWSLSVNEFEVCVVDSLYSVYIEDAEQVLLTPLAMEVALFISRNR